MDFVFFEMIADTGASVLMLFSVFILKKPRQIFLDCKAKHMALAVSSGVMGVFLSQLFFCVGLRNTNATFSAPWMLLTPLFTTMFGIILGYEAKKAMKIIGIIISVIAASGSISYESVKQTGDLVGEVFLLLHSLFLCFGIIVWRKLVNDFNHSSLVVATWSVTAGSLFMVVGYFTQPYWYALEINATQDLAAVVKIPGITFMIVLAYSCNYSILAWATYMSNISIVALYASARPIFTTVLSYFIHKLPVYEILISCSLLVVDLTGLLVTCYSKRMEKKAHIFAKNDRTKGKLSNNFRTMQVTNFEQPFSQAPNYKRIL